MTVSANFYLKQIDLHHQFQETILEYCLFADLKAMWTNNYEITGRITNETVLSLKTVATKNKESYTNASPPFSRLGDRDLVNGDVRRGDTERERR